MDKTGILFKRLGEKTNLKEVFFAIKDEYDFYVPQNSYYEDVRCLYKCCELAFQSYYNKYYPYSQDNIMEWVEKNPEIFFCKALEIFFFEGDRTAWYDIVGKENSEKLQTKLINIVRSLYN